MATEATSLPARMSLLLLEGLVMSDLIGVRDAVHEAIDAARGAAIAVKRLMTASAALDRLAAVIQQALVERFPTLDVRVSGPTEWMLDCGRTAHGIERFIDISDRDFPRPSYNVWVVPSRKQPWLRLGRNPDGNWCWVDQLDVPTDKKLPVDAETFKKACVEVTRQVDALVDVLRSDLEDTP